MPTVVGVKLRFAPKVLSFDPAGTEPQRGDTVVVDTERGTEVGEVFEVAHEVAKSDLPGAPKPVVRIATDEDFAHLAELAEQERAALPVFRELINKYKLDMKPVAVEFLFNDDKAVFYFSAEERVDFRELVRDLASRFHQRIDMRQVGVRDEARIVGGIGHCGQQLCCDRFAGEFQPVSIRMAKEQDLPLNPLKISGLCGRLMCCLRYEFDAYKDYKSRAPKRGAMIETPLGEGKVVDLNTPKETVTIRIPEGGGTLTVPLATMECGSGKGCPCVVRREALEEAGVALPASIAPPSEKPAEERKGRSAKGERKREDGKREEGKSRDRQDGKPRERQGQGRGKGAQAPKAAPATQEAKAGGAGEAKAAEGTSEAKGRSSGRRRRRRRPSGGGTGTESGSTGTPT